MKTAEEKNKAYKKLSSALNSDMPTDVFLHGDGTIWMKFHGNEGVRLRKVTQEDAVRIIYKAIRYGEQLISV